MDDFRVELKVLGTWRETIDPPVDDDADERVLNEVTEVMDSVDGEWVDRRVELIGLAQDSEHDPATAEVAVSGTWRLTHLSLNEESAEREAKDRLEETLDPEENFGDYGYASVDVRPVDA